MVNIRKISEDSFDALIGMNRSEGDPFVASNAVTLGHALLQRGEVNVFPFAIYNDDTVVGFMLLEENLEDERLDLWRIMLTPGKRWGRGMEQVC